MPEPRNDMFPPADPGSDPVIVTTPPAPVPPVEHAPAAVPPSPVVTTPSGANTPVENLKAALDEERRMRKEERDRAEAAEERVRILESTGAPSESLDDDALTPGEKLLKKQLDETSRSLRQIQRDRETDRVVAQYPQLKDLRSEFETFAEDYPANTGREKLAKIFLAEKEILNVPPARPGLERPSAGPRETATTTKFSIEEIDRMMKNEPRRFNKLIASGLIRPEDVPQ